MARTSPEAGNAQAIPGDRGVSSARRAGAAVESPSSISSSTGSIRSAGTPARGVHADAPRRRLEELLARLA